MANDWRKTLSFADRLNASSSIVSAYKTANPDCNPSDASKYGKTTEDMARKQALSLQEYHELCEKNVQLLLMAAPLANTPEEEDGDEPSEPGIQIGPYTNAQHFQNGLFSDIYKATSPTNPPHTIALKLTTPTVMTPPHNTSREARLLLLATHPNTIPLLSSLPLPPTRHALAFPYKPYDLSTLLHHPPSNRPLTPQTRRAILRDLFAALAHIHAQGIIHRDVKPTNILLASPTGPAVLADFGIAWHASSATRPAEAPEPADEKILDVGTTCYRAPELLFGNRSYGFGLDLWAAGCLGAEVLGGTAGREGGTLFDSGEVGSELALVRSLFETLGTPDGAVWPEAKGFPDWGKMNFKKYPGMAWEEIMPRVEVEGRDLVSRLVVFESGDRLTAEEALEHPYLREAAG